MKPSRTRILFYALILAVIAQVITLAALIAVRPASAQTIQHVDLTEVVTGR